MTSYIEYGVKLSDGQKSKLLSAIQNKSPLTLRLKHSNLKGPDELMLTQRQIEKIKKPYCPFLFTATITCKWNRIRLENK